MRISAVEGDIGYHPYMALTGSGLTVDVMIDGEPLKDCITADSKRGEAVIYARDSDGHLIHSPDTGDLVSLTVLGKIEFTIRHKR